MIARWMEDTELDSTTIVKHYKVLVCAHYTALIECSGFMSEQPVTCVHAWDGPVPIELEKIIYNTEDCNSQLAPE